MNNKSIKKNILKISTMCLLIGLFLFISCGSNDSGEDDKVLTKQYLSLKSYGLTDFKVTNYSEEETFSLGIKRIGGTFTTELNAKLETWSKEELEAYNKKEEVTYILLPETSYSISKNVSFAAGADETTVEIKVNPTEIFSKQEDLLKDYVIALKLKSDDVELRKGQSDLLLRLVVDYARVGFTSTEVDKVNVNEAITNFKIMTSLDYKVDGVISGSNWDFSCKLKVPDNAAELVAAYNQKYKSNYELLPQGSYTLGDVTYTVGSKEAEGMLTITRNAIEVKYYMLPLTLANISTESVLCNDEVHYATIGQTYSNPIITHTSAADPTVINVDGTFYLYATQTGSYWVPVYSSKDLVNWKYERTAFVNAYKPNLPGGGTFWAPEIRYINGQYVLYYSWAKLNGANQSYTAVAVSDNPLGPFKDSKELLGNEEFGSNCIDQFYIEDGGKKYMFYGSFQGIYVTELTDDGLSVKRDAANNPVLKKKVCGNAYEGVNIYKKNGFYYLLASIGSCCAGENSTYELVVGRSQNILGPYVDRKNVDMINNSWESVLAGNITKWIGPGHNAIIVQDDVGTEWMVYHSFRKIGTQFTGRHGMLDRLQWSDDGWPYVKGYVPSDTDLIPVFYNK